MKKNINIIIFAVLLTGILSGCYKVDARGQNDTISLNQNVIDKSYEIELNKFKIQNNGSMAKETSKGINEALQFAKEQGYNKVIFPKGIYLIDETNPIILDMQNVIIDLNGTTLQINSNGLDKYSIVTFKDGAENLRLTNGTIRGDKDTHDYKTVNSSHEWACGLTFEGGNNLEVDNVTISNTPGYGVNTKSGNDKNRFNAISAKDLEFGSISTNGELIDKKDIIRTNKAFDISMIGTQFELGYTLGYQGYPYLKNKEYTAYFYDKNMNFIESKECLQFRKISIPQNSVYIKFMFPQNFIPTNVNQVAWVSNFKPPTNVNLHDCVIKDNRTLGLAFCGGQKWIIENNLFEGNGGNAPGYAVDFEDGWELMQDVIFRNNKFKNNAGDLVACAGDNFLFEGNEFSSTVYMWGRTTNYKFFNNIFNSQKTTYEYSTNIESKNNVYINSELRVTEKDKNNFKPIINNEKFNNSNVFIYANEVEITDSNIKNDKGKSIFLQGIFRNCNINLQEANLKSSKMYSCVIENSYLTAQGNSIFEECNIVNSEIRTTSNTESIKFNKANFKDGTVKLNTWGNAVDINIENSNIIMENGNRAVIEISAAKIKNLMFKNNTVINGIKKPTFNMFDTTYRVPAGNVVIENNKITQTNYKYVFDGVNINSGIVNFTQKNNTLNGAETLNPKYINNQYFKIIN